MIWVSERSHQDFASKRRIGHAVDTLFLQLGRRQREDFLRGRQDSNATILAPNPADDIAVRGDWQDWLLEQTATEDSATEIDLADWQALLGVEVTLPVVEGVGSAVVSMLAAVSRVVGEASTAALPCVREQFNTDKAAALCVVAGEAQHPLFRVKESFHYSESSTLGVQKGVIVRVLAETETELGWVYAEDIGFVDKSGWLPIAILEQLPGNQRLLSVVQTSVVRFANQLEIQKGMLLLANADSRTEKDGSMLRPSSQQSLWVRIILAGCQWFVLKRSWPMGDRQIFPLEWALSEGSAAVTFCTVMCALV